MTKKEFQDLTKDRYVLLDGATGSNLQKHGMPSGVCPELWITQNPEILIGLQKEYVNAGTQILYAPTFTANRIKLKEYGLEDRIRELNHKLIGLSKEAAQGQALVAGDLTMTGEQLAPVGRLDFEELVDVYKEQIGYISEAGADLLVIETMMSLQETRAALLAAKEVCPDMPVMVTMTFEEDARTLFGTDGETAAVVLESLGADALGANCSSGPEQMAAVISRMAAVTSLPLIAKPNAGLPSLDQNGNTIYSLNAGDFAEEMLLLARAGASMLGGCCGTTPIHISSLGKRLMKADAGFADTVGKVRRRPKEIRFLASERRTVRFGLHDSFLVVGERINPTGKKKLQEELRNGRMDMVLRFAEEQEAAGASLLDINVGMSGVDEKQLMLQVMEETMSISQLPLSLDSSHVEVLEAALRRYPGRALINSISLETVKIEQLLPLAGKYGAMFILLPLSDAGLPKNLDEKKKIIETILERTASLGMNKEDVVVDGLVTTVGANPRAALETLETIRYCRDMGLATVCGLSNISFGLPERGYINSAFLTMAIQAGLTMAIANPSSELLVAGALAADLLLGKENSDIRYIDYSTACKERQIQRIPAPEIQQISPVSVPEQAKPASSTPESDDVSGPGQDVYEAVLKGKRKNIEELTQKALHAGMPAKAILDDRLLPAINKVGEYFDKGQYFLPQLIASAEAMKLSVGILEPLLATGRKNEDMPTVVIATVQGDIHDIGKNLVALMLRNYGFRVIDLGKDVPKEKIIEAAREYHAQIIGLSALMTTTMQEMKHVIEYAKQEGLNARIMIGGAVITQDYAREIHADGYSADAADAVRVAGRLLKGGQ